MSIPLAICNNTHPGKDSTTNVKDIHDQNDQVELSALNLQINNNKDVNFEKISDESKQKVSDDVEDSFELFLPLKVKKKNSDFASSPKKFKKKRTVSSNRICPYFSKKKSPTTTKEEKDLQIALARSLADISNNDSSENGFETLTLEKKASKQKLDFLKNLTSKTKKPSSKSLLFRRTVDERQNILTQKVAIVLIGKENVSNDCFEKKEIELISSTLEEAWDKDTTLWERSKGEVNNLAEFYVTNLQKFIEQPSVISEMPEASIFKENNSKVSSNVMDIKVENEGGEIEDIYVASSDEDKRECDLEFNNYDINDFNECNTSNKNKLIIESLNVLSEDFFEIFGTNEFSDIEVILRTSEILPCHRLILKIRCPPLLFNSEISKVSNTLDFTQYSTEAAKAFFKYIYTGKIEFMFDLSAEDKSDLFVLAKKYSMEFLQQFMLEAFRSDSFHLYSQSTCSPPHGCSKNSSDSIQKPKQNLPNVFLGLSPLSQNTHFKDELQLPNNEKVYKSYVNNSESVNHQPSCSNLNSSKNNHSFQENMSFLTYDNSSYDIFKDEVKSSCNSSVLFQSLSQTKRKLNYSIDINESKKLCCENISDDMKSSSPEVVALDSDSDYECSGIQKNCLPNNSRVTPDFPKVYKKLPLNENSKSPDFNIADCHGTVRDEEKVFSEGLLMDSCLHAVSPVRTIPLSITRPSPSVIEVPSNSKKSIDKYFEASFPDINENIDRIETQNTFSTPSPLVKKNLFKHVATPLQEIIFDNATPKPNYSAMISPELKIELRKYGIKPDLDKKKARTLLRYIYEQIHPITSQLPRYKSPVPSTSKERTPSPVIVIDDDSDEFVQTDNRMNSETDFAYEEYLFNHNKKMNESFSNQSGSNLKKTVINFIRSDDELFSNVVLFRPLLLKKFYKTFKEHGVQCSLYELMDALDDLCVNYHVEKNETKQKRRYKKKSIRRKQPKKTI